ncbi:MAG TPA: ATP synthase F0 subunit B [Thermoanaerobaculia bacterium]
MQINLTPDYSLLAIVVIFILNYLVVRKFFLQPINEVIESREGDVRSANEVYEQSMARFNEATTQMEEKLHAARHAAADVRDRFRREAAAYRTTVVTKTHDDASGIVSEADEKLKGDIAAARAKIVTESESLARLAAERILGRPV